VTPGRRWAQWGVLALLLALAYGASLWWRAGPGDEAAQALAAAARPGDIQMISSETCVYCVRARHWLRQHGVAFSECLVERDADCAARYQGLGAPGTPVMVVRQRVMLGFSPRAVLAALQPPAPPVSSRRVPVKPASASPANSPRP
jgi:glutaredoxin